MRFPPIVAALSVLVSSLPANSYSQEKELPKGEVTKHAFENSKIFPGTYRDYWIYVPKQYDPAKPACVFVCQDGIQYNAPAVFDKLIAAGEIPVTIGVFVMHGRVKAQSDQALDRFNRSFEYDGLGDNYARFILDELLPEVEKKTTADGRPIRLSKSGNDRAIAGNSSGAICAFTAAWERPDAFTRVFSAIGTYVGLRGGNVYPTLIRKYEPKPLRIFLEDGSNDLNIYGGDWWMANQEMERALTFAGYEVKHSWGDGGHNGKHATEIFPEAIKWLWSGWPEPVKSGKGSQPLQEILIPGEDWKLVGEGYAFTEGPTADPKGVVYFNDIPGSTTYRIGDDSKPVAVNTKSNRANGMGYGPDGRRYVVETGTEKVVSIGPDGDSKTVAEGFRGNDLVVLANGNVYVTNPSQTNEPGKVWLIKPDGTKSVVDTGLNFPNGVTVSPDQSLLYVAEARSHWVWSWQILPDGSLAHKQRYYHLHMPDSADYAGADGMRVDTAGRLYVATRLGIQVCDQAGRVNAIIPTPNGKSSNLTFGGPNFDTLYVTAGEKVYSRKVKTTGANAWQPPIKPAPPRL
ncbi:gluconolactonase [bacterium]|nr:gluconolactonase [bacterium]